MAVYTTETESAPGAKKSSLHRHVVHACPFLPAAPLSLPYHPSPTLKHEVFLAQSHLGSPASTPTPLPPPLLSFPLQSACAEAELTTIYASAWILAASHLSILLEVAKQDALWDWGDFRDALQVVSAQALP